MPNWDQYLENNARFWREAQSSAEARGRCILVDLAHDGPVYVNRNLVIAKLVQRLTGLPIVGLVGVPFNLDVDREAFVSRHEPLARSFGVDRFIVTPENPSRQQSEHKVIADAVKAPEDEALLADTRRAIRDLCDANGFPVGRYIMDTFTRSERVPSLRGGAALQFWSNQAADFVAWASALVKAEGVEVFVTGHIDYLPWGAMSEAVAREGGRVVYQRTDTRANMFVLQGADTRLTLTGRCRVAEAKAFAAFSERASPRTDQHAREECRLALEFGFGYDPLSGRRPPERDRTPEDWRNEFFGGDTRPVVCMFTHTFSDICACDDGLFVDYLEWTELCLQRAGDARGVNLLVKVHPLHGAYDQTNSLDVLRSKYEDHHNIAFFSSGPSRRALAEFADVGVTVRGTPGFEFAAAGLPMAIAGKGFYSDAGVAPESADREAHLAIFDGDVSRIRAGHSSSEAQRYFAFATRWARPTSFLMPPFGVYQSDAAYTERLSESWSHRVEEDDVFLALRDAWDAGDAKVVCRKAAQWL